MGGKVDSEREYLRGDSEGEFPSKIGYVIFLAEELENRGSKDVNRQENDACDR